MLSFGVGCTYSQGVRQGQSRSNQDVHRRLCLCGRGEVGGASRGAQTHRSRRARCVLPPFSFRDKKGGGFFFADISLHFFLVAPTVNNVGVSHEIPADFVDTSPEELAKIINVNVTATLRITSLIAPAMVSRYVPFSPSLMAAARYSPHTALLAKVV